MELLILFIVGLLIAILVLPLSRSQKQTAQSAALMT